MKNGLLICSGSGKDKNIGDYIQSLAQEQFLPSVDYFVEREEMDQFEATEKVNIIMNGWFMHQPEKFPPSKWINPLFISFHIVPRNAKRMLTPKVIDYLKKFEPIGTRDTGTCELLKKYGVDSFFSGCLTLTLGLKYHEDEKNEKVIFTDPYYEYGNGKSHSYGSRILAALWYYLRYRRKVNLMYKSFVWEKETPISRYFPKWDKRMMLASFYKTYSAIFSDEVLFNAEFVTHNVKQSLFKNEDDKLLFAKGLITKYAKAKYVVTSRIHCALPCVGVETPVLFVTSDVLEGDTFRSAGRFGGLIDFLHVLRWTPKGVKNCSSLPFSESNKIVSSFTFKNKDNYIPYRDDLIKRVKTFVMGDS